MCGIAGIFHYADPDCPVDRDLLTRMTRAIAHRGPDAEDFHVEPGLGLGHRRLSIVDLSPTGAQPMATEDGACWIAYNGEFYNHQEFRPRLASRGARFRGTSDTETLLYLMQQEGPEALSATAGIFAFAYWDSRQKLLTLARDHMGVKQLYFHDDGRRIIFASEVKALLQDPTVPRAIDPEAVNQYLHFHTALFERTFFRDIRVLRAGEYLLVSRYGARCRTYWSLTDFTKTTLPEDQVVEQLRHELTSIVGRQMMSDVPVGAFFSGGIDSSAIAAHASMTGKAPMCFGVHFTDQGVTDERPYQEAAAKALNLDLRLITMDGADFPDEFRRLIYHQDEPVIGSALFPMARVSELASSNVKVCLGGQAADEVFGGYARYALSHPLKVMGSWFAGGRQSGSAQTGATNRQGEAHVGGNLRRQFAEGGTISRLARNLRHMSNWETSYFEHFAKIPETSWQKLLDPPELCSRERCRQIFHETVAKSPATDPLDKLMHWDVQSYLTGLFHQDDRMSMAASLESRVPFADPRLVQFAFRVRPDMKLRAGASKWILREAVSDVLPAFVLNRRKVGFDTPAERWIRSTHTGFVRDTLLSARARQRGLWNHEALERDLDNQTGGEWFDTIWKALSIELWASVFLDSTPVSTAGREHRAPEVGRNPEPAGPEKHHFPGTEKLSHLAQECRELGVRGTLARGLWEVKTRSGLAGVRRPPEFSGSQDAVSPGSNGVRLPFADPKEVGEILRTLIPRDRADQLQDLARKSTRGEILCFSDWMADFGNPIDWHRDPTNGHRWSADAHWTRVLRNAAKVDVKFTWEVARFPHAYQMARAAAMNPQSAPFLSDSFAAQVNSFMSANPVSRGVHWYSGQEVAFRVFAWLFGLHVFSGLGVSQEGLAKTIGRALADAGAHISEHIEYARDSVYNNHLLSEALGIYLAGRLVPGANSKAWAEEGFGLLESQASLQIYPDGSYIQQAHNYQRVAMQLYLLATAFLRANREAVPAAWTVAMERSLDFLYAHQNEADGRLPNYGANDGSKPIPLSTSDFPDFRPLLQALSIATRGERLYPPGHWDETSLWHFGPGAMDLPLRPRERKSVSFSHTGHHVLRGSGGSFGAFRCGTIIDRFAQIDMLHLDVWWKGQNVLVDGGSYRYNGAPSWHNHFLRTESHNTVKVDGRDQMVHFRQFKILYWTQAKLLRFEQTPAWTIAEGEHYGFQRVSHCTHRRAVLQTGEDLWICLDTVSGQGRHEFEVQWIGGEFPYAFDSGRAQLTLNTPEGPFCVAVFDQDGAPCSMTSVAAGQVNPPRGWLSRYYGSKTPVPSLVAAYDRAVPYTIISVLSGGDCQLTRNGSVWQVETSGTRVSFGMLEGRFENPAVEAKQ